MKFGSIRRSDKDLVDHGQLLKGASLVLFVLFLTPGMYFIGTSVPGGVI